MTARRVLHLTVRACILAFLVLLVGTLASLRTIDLHAVATQEGRAQVLDRHGVPLAVSYQNRFNTLDHVALHEVPDFLWKSFILSEDKNFFQHHGVDWRARFSALAQNMKAGRKVRGASTITEQVVRIVDSRPRTYWSRWVEGFESMLLEQRNSKGRILEFYLNQVPYASHRRGITQAARYYFNRDLSTLTRKEMLALAVLPRAPSALDLYVDPSRIEAPMARLAERMVASGALTASERDAILAETFVLQPAPDPVNAQHFVNYIRDSMPGEAMHGATLRTTLDAGLQQRVQNFLDERVASLSRRQVQNGAALVVDHTTGEILAWSVVGANDASLGRTTPGRSIDAVRAPRQPGSALKPFLYALALDKGWSAATILNDAPMAEAIGSGLHDFHNYSRTFYGPVTFREALGNSLNIPALLTIAFVRPDHYLRTLHALGFTTLGRDAEFYKDGLALGNGEVTLLAMVQAYSALAERGNFRALTPLLSSGAARPITPVYSPEAASLIGNILSDPHARRREFGAGSVLNLPVQTAVKTGTSNDYTDAWTLGYNARYTVGVWFGNLNRTPMDGVTGSTGPALVLRSIFAELENNQKSGPLYLSPKLVQREVCSDPTAALDAPDCFPHSEYFMPGTIAQPPAKPVENFRIMRPSKGLNIAYDPRVPADHQAFEFVVVGAGGHKLLWRLDGRLLGVTDDPSYLWPVARGNHTLTVSMLKKDGTVGQTEKVPFLVK